MKRPIRSTPVPRIVIPSGAWIILVLIGLAPRLAAATSSISEIKTYGSFETAGVIIKVEGMDFIESATIEYRKAGTIAFRRGHDFIRYDGNHMATSLFGLAKGSPYDLRA
jgi:hypothetical protein